MFFLFLLIQSSRAVFKRPYIVWGQFLEWLWKIHNGWYLVGWYYRSMSTSGISFQLGSFLNTNYIFSSDIPLLLLCYLYEHCIFLNALKHVKCLTEIHWAEDIDVAQHHPGHADEANAVNGAQCALLRSACVNHLRTVRVERQGQGSAHQYRLTAPCKSPHKGKTCQSH